MSDDTLVWIAEEIQTLAAAFHSRHMPGDQSGEDVKIVQAIGECAMGLHRIADALDEIAGRPGRDPLSE